MHCEQTHELTDELSYFLDCFMLYGLGILWLITSSSSVFTNKVLKKQSNIRITRYYKRNDLAISFDKSGDAIC